MDHRTLATRNKDVYFVIHQYFCFFFKLETSNKIWLDHILFLVMSLLGVLCLEEQDNEP